MSTYTEQDTWFASTVKPHEPILRGYLQKRFPSLPDHDDIVQEAYTRVLRQKEKGPLASTRAYLFTVARNVAIDMIRRRRVHLHDEITDQAETLILEDTPSQPDFLDRQDRLDTLLEAILALPDRRREVMMLRHFDGFDRHQISEKLGISPNTVRNHMVQGLADCMAFFRSRGVLDTAAPSIPQPEEPAP